MQVPTPSPPHEEESEGHGQPGDGETGIGQREPERTARPDQPGEPGEPPGRAAPLVMGQPSQAAQGLARSTTAPEGAAVLGDSQIVDAVVPGPQVRVELEGRAGGPPAEPDHGTGEAPGHGGEQQAGEHRGPGRGVTRGTCWVGEREVRFGHGDQVTVAGASPTRRSVELRAVHRRSLSSRPRDPRSHDRCPHASGVVTSVMRFGAPVRVAPRRAGWRAAATRRLATRCGSHRPNGRSRRQRPTGSGRSDRAAG